MSLRNIVLFRKNANPNSKRVAYYNCYSSLRNVRTIFQLHNCRGPEIAANGQLPVSLYHQHSETEKRNQYSKLQTRSSALDRTIPRSIPYERGKK